MRNALPMVAYYGYTPQIYAVGELHRVYINSEACGEPAS